MILKVVKYKCPSKEYRILSKGKGQNFLFKETLFKEKWTYILNSLGYIPKSRIAGLCNTLNLASLQPVQSFMMI